MAEVTKESAIANITSGIIMPMIKNKWRLVSVSGLEEKEVELLTLQLVRLKYRYTTPNSFGLRMPHDLFMVVEEPVGGGAFGKLAHIVSKMAKMSMMDIVVANLDSEISVIKTTTFKDSRLLGYDYDLDYAKSESCEFPLEFVCNDIIYN